jgi:hypothetical protein
MGFSISIDPPRSIRTRQATLQCCGQTLLDKLLTHSPNRRGADFQGLVDLLIGPAWPFFTRISGCRKIRAWSNFRAAAFPAEII